MALYSRPVPTKNQKPPGQDQAQEAGGRNRPADRENGENTGLVEVAHLYFDEAEGLAEEINKMKIN